MTQEDRISAGERVCRNCRYLAQNSGETLRCADPAAHDFHREVAARGTCGRFQISFKAVRQMAFEQSGHERVDLWDMSMHRRSHAHRIGT